MYLYNKMAGIVGTGLSSVFAAISFSAAGFLFSKFNHTGYEKEMKRHNNALEELAKAKEKWYENEIGKKDRIQELRQQLSDANHDINDTNKALDELRRVLTVSYQGKTFMKEPNLNDYYKPSSEMKKYQEYAVGGAGFGVGWLIHKFI